MRVDAAHYGSERFTPPRRVVVRVSRCADTLSANVFMSLDELASSASRTRTWSACFVKQNKFGALVDLQAWRVTSSVRAPACLASVSLEATALCCSVSQPWYLVKNKTKQKKLNFPCRFTTFSPRLFHHGKRSCCPDGSRQHTSLRNFKHDWMSRECESRALSCFPFLAAEDEL